MTEPVRKVFVGSDHGGWSLKQELIGWLAKEFSEIEWIDLGCDAKESSDYPQFAFEVGKKVSAGEGLGLLICGSGIGMSIAANKIKGVRAALVWNETAARLSREHNNANIVCMGERLIGSEVAKNICAVFFSTAFAGGRHERRVQLIADGER